MFYKGDFMKTLLLALSLVTMSFGSFAQEKAKEVE